MTLIKTSLLNAVAVLVKMLTMLAINKILAIYVGPAGYAVIGQFQNAVQIVSTFASGAINTGVTKYTAEYSRDESHQKRLWKTAGSIAIICTFFVSLSIVLYRRELAIWVLQDGDLSGVFVWFGLTLIFFVFNTLLLAILNGKKETNVYIICNIVGSVFSLIFTVVLVIFSGLYGALVGLAVYQSMSFLVTLFFVSRINWFSLRYLAGSIDSNIAKKLASYALMAATSAICLPVVNILVRNHLGSVVSWEAAGYWEAMCRLSAAYLMFVTTTLSLYYLPKLSEISAAREIKSEIIYVYRIVLPVAALLGVFIYVMRDLIIGVLFSEDFGPMRELFAMQMLGDLLKIGSWIVAYFMLAKAMTKTFIFTEIFFATTFYGASIICINLLGLKGVLLSYAISYAVYWVVVGYFVRKKIASFNY